MKLTTGTGWGAVSCQISPAQDVTVENRLRFHPETDTVCYAVCRFFTKTPALCRAYARESYRMRLAKGKGRRPQRHRITLPAPLLELPAGWVQVRFQVDPEGVTVRQVVLTERFPGL